MPGSAEIGVPASCGIVETILLNTAFFLPGTMNTPTTASPPAAAAWTKCEAFALDEVFARMMEVKLCQPKAAVTQLKGIAPRGVELDRVAIVDDSLRALAPVDLERWLACGATNRARRIRCIEVAHLSGPVAPS
jgi:hypothetical protein